jgi:hypothetical protein
MTYGLAAAAAGAGPLGPAPGVCLVGVTADSPAARRAKGVEAAVEGGAGLATLLLCCAACRAATLSSACCRACSRVSTREARACCWGLRGAVAVAWLGGRGVVCWLRALNCSSCKVQAA